MDFCKATLKLTSFFCVTPTSDLNTYKPTYWQYLKTAAFIIPLAFFYGWSFMGNSGTRFGFMNGVNVFVTIFCGTISALFVIVTILRRHFNTKIWNKFCDGLNCLEENNKIVKNSKFKSIFWLFALHLILFIYFGVYTYVWTDFDHLNIFCYQYYRMLNFYFMFLLICFTDRVGNVLTGRLEDLERILQVNSAPKPDKMYLKLTTTNVKNKCFIENIRTATKLYGTVVDVIKYFNEMYGWQILLLISYNVVNLLENVNNVRKGANGLYSVGVTIITICATAKNLLTCLMLIVPCDKTAQRRLQLLETCQNLEETLPVSSEERNEILNLMDVIINRGCYFSAADFFELDRKTLFGVLSTTTTYLIVLFQFDK